MPNNIEKVIYFDCDSLIVDSIDDLWNININNYLCASVLDTTVTYFKNVIGLSDDNIYINAGMLLINIKRWREENLEDKFIDFLNDYYGKNIHHDQGIINGVLKNQILVIVPRFNLLGPFHGKDYAFVLKWFGVSYNYYSRDIIENAQNHPVFLHFSGGSIERPWFNDKHFYRELFDEYAKLIDYDYARIYRKTGSISTIGKFYIFLSENKFFYFIMKLIPKKIAIYFKNWIIYKQINE